jgi:hypothetical protein
MSISIEEKVLDFLREWKVFASQFHQFIDVLGMGWVNDGKERRDVFDEISEEEREQFFNHRNNLRKKLFFLGESNLIPGTVYSWEKLKVEYPPVSGIGFLTPFSLVLEVSCLVDVFHVTKPSDKEHPVRVALFVAEDFIEYLTYKYPLLEELKLSE